MLFIIPGLIATYRYAMAPYIMAEHPEMGDVYKRQYEKCGSELERPYPSPKGKKKAYKLGEICLLYTSIIGNYDADSEQASNTFNEFAVKSKDSLGTMNDMNEGINNICLLYTSRCV